MDFCFHFYVVVDSFSNISVKVPNHAFIKLMGVIVLFSLLLCLC